MEIIDSDVAKITAIHCEDYKMAQLMKDKIDRLTLEIPKT